ncbi:MjaI family restriction endonuclease [Thermotoga profunda]|uniref:MjaI family restriction endonuclease n=1 Tax=Thermotoga profunda TaxID=1508420 RepID=UPI0005970E9F|nr:MjaI family restriction endonuclease [Thermotoga profunda]
MAREWILNMATNRWGLNKKDSVGPLSEWIRTCNPKNTEDWEKFYFGKLSEFLQNKGIKLTPEQYLQDLGKKLFVKISEVIQSEIDEVTEEDCIEYIRNLVIERTFMGYQTEIKTIYGKLQKVLEVKIEPAPDEWDRLYNVDFFINVNKKYIGIQVKPITYNQTPELYRWKEWLAESHRKFEERFGGKVFVVFSCSVENGKKEIYNKEIIEEIKNEINRLKKNIRISKE